MIDERKPESHIKIGDFYLRQIKISADVAFNESFIDVKLNRKEHCFEVWVAHDVDKDVKKRFQDKFKLCKIRVFKEETDTKKL